MTFAIIESPGTDTERTVASCPTLKTAIQTIHEMFTPDELDDGAADIARVLPDGTMSFEY